MDTKNRILLFTHSSQDLCKQQILAALHGTGIQQEEVLLLDERDTSLSGLDQIQAYIILFTSELERDKNVFALIEAIEKDPDAATFFIFPPNDAAEKIVFPPLFHSLRSRNHKLYEYEKKGDQVQIENILQDLMKDFRKTMQEMAKKNSSQESPEEKKTLKGWLSGIWANPRTRTVLFMIPIFVILVILLIRLLPSTVETVQQAQVTPMVVPPPDMQEIWLQETFEDGYLHENWDVSHRYRGKNYFDLNYDGTALLIMAEPPVVDVVYSLISVNTYPLDNLQALKTDFFFDPLEETESAVSITMQLVQTEDSQYRLECQVSPGKEQGVIQCFIHEPQGSTEISSAVFFSPGDWHSLTLSFDPENYVVLLFLDDLYQGEAEIPAVEYWRERQMNVVVATEMQALEQNGYSCQIDNIILSHTP
jgi:hypothetical protein